MKFSYSLIKKMVPGLGSAKDFVDRFNAYGFEVEGVEGDTVEIKLPANRYADAYSHWGIAKEAAAIWNTKLKDPVRAIVNLPEKGLLSTRIEDSSLCNRYAVRMFEIGKHAATPEWMQDALDACGLRPINLIVDVMNYVMLEVGEPLHAFDAEKVHGEKVKKFLVRQAREGEKIETIDGHSHTLHRDMLVISDSERALAVAGIKGGKHAEVSRDTKRIIVEAAYFDPVSIFKTAKKLKLATDASSRFAHGLHPELVPIALDRATVLLRELASATLIDTLDTYPKKANAEVIGLSVPKLNSVLGTSLTASEIIKYLGQLGFAVRPKKKDMLVVDVPSLRSDVAIQEDLIEEVARLYGMSNIEPQAPVSMLKPSEYEDEVKLKDNIRHLLVGMGLSEVYNSSFLEKGSVELENPIAEDKKYLRPELAPGILKNCGDNFRFFDEVRVFEIGKVFSAKDDKIRTASAKAKEGSLREEWRLALALARKKGSAFLELKGILSELMERLGVVEYRFAPKGEMLVLESDHHVLGYCTTASVDKKYAASLTEIYLEELLEVVVGEKEYEPLPKYPGITRDVSLFVNREVRVGEILEVMNNVPTKYVEDVDMIDFYEDPNLSEEKKSVTFRFVFQAEDRTLTDAEAGEELEKILQALREKFDIEVR